MPDHPNDPPALVASPRPTRRRSDFVTLAVLLLSIPLIVFGISHVELENEIEDWLPQQDGGAQILEWHHDHFDPLERFLVSWDSSSLDDPRLEQLASELAEPADAEGNRQGRIPGIARVSTPRDLIRRMRENNVPLDEAVDQIVGVAIGRGFLKVRLSEHGQRRRESTERVIFDRIRELGIEPQILPAMASQEGSAPSPIADDSGLPAKLLNIPSHDFQIRWKGMTPASSEGEEIQRVLTTIQDTNVPLVESADFFPGAPAALTVILSSEGSDAVTKTAREVEAAAIRIGIPVEELHYGGGPIGRSRLNQEAERALWNTDYPAWNLFKRSPVLLSVIVGSVCAFFFLGSLRTTLIVLAASIYIPAATVALIPLLGDTMSMVLVVMPNLLFVVTMSGAIHIVNYWRSEALKDPATAVDKAVRHGAIPCALASLTTAVGTASLFTSPLSPIVDFGLYSTIGILLSLAMVLCGIPSMLRIAGGRPFHRRSYSHWAWRGLGRTTARYYRAVQFMMLLITLHALWGLNWFQTEAKVIRYFPDHLRIIKDYEFFESSLAGVVNVDILMHFNETGREKLDIAQRIELIRAAEEAVQQDRGVTGTLSLADFRSPLSTPDRNDPLITRMLYRSGLRRLKAGIFGDSPTSSETAASDEENSSSPPGGDPAPSTSLAAIVHRPLEATDGGRSVAFLPGDEVWRIRVQCTVLENVDYASLVDNIERRIEEAVGTQPGVDFIVTGSVPLFLRAQQALIDSLIRSLGLAFVVITLMMIVFVHSIIGGLLAMLPNVFPLAVTFGWLSWAQVPVDVGTMMTASIALGIAIDGTLHLITWYLQFVPLQRHRPEAIRDALDQGGPPVFQTSVILSLGMLMLAGADLLLIARFGYVMSLLVVTALIGDIVLLPALLASWLGWLVGTPTFLRSPVVRRRKKPRSPQGESHQPAADGSSPPVEVVDPDRTPA